jgi:hypothetical protein
MVALAMAVGVMPMAVEKGPSMYETAEVRTV